MLKKRDLKYCSKVDLKENVITCLKALEDNEAILDTY